MTYRERRERRAERLREWSDKRAARSAESFRRAQDAIAGIPVGQPILVGHHSEKRHRRDLDKHDRAMRAGVESAEMSRSMSSRADEIERQADVSIYSDDVDAVERLRDKLTGLEAERDRIKTVNKAIRKHGLAELIKADCAILTPALSDAEKLELLRVMQHQPYYNVETKGYPAYHLSNLNSNITRTRQRLEALSGTPGAAPVLDAATATARAGLTITADMTRPSRPGKAPRPVWTVTGALSNWRQSLLLMGGSWYRGAVSFWDDPTEAIEQMCAEAETTVDSAKL